MKKRVSDDQIRRHIPSGRKIPLKFDAFLQANPPVAVEWNDLDAYGLRPTAAKEVVPFLRLGDGGLVAFWYRSTSPAIVHIGGHGELEVIARNFGDFLMRVAAKCSGLIDFDEASFSVPGVKGEPKCEGLPALQQEFDEWFKKHTSLLEPLQTPETDALRQRVHRIAEGMLRDGRSKVYKLSSSWWSINFQIERSDTNLRITYLDYGKWYPVPKKYKLVGEVTDLLKLVKHKRRNRYELSTCSAGIVSIDGDRELVLVPPSTEE